MRFLLFSCMIGLSIVLSGCVSSILIKPGSPAPRVSINPAKSSDRAYVSTVASHFQQAGYQVVSGGPSEYDLNFGVADKGVYVEAHMMMYGGAEKVTDGSARVFARPRYANQASVANEAVAEALHDLEVPVVRTTRSR